MRKTDWSNRVKELFRIWTEKGIPEYRKVMIGLITQYLRENPEWSLLDAGCGNGLVFEYLDEDLRERYVGFDFTPEMIDYCRNKYPEYEDQFIIADVQTPNIPYGDLVITQNVVQHTLMFQKSLENLIYMCNEVLLLCERTHNDKSIKIGKDRRKHGFTVLVGRNPNRWRFNENDFLDMINFYGELCGFKKAEVISRPKSTQNLSNVLSIYRMVKQTNLQ